jgi:hypothetical protein
MRSEEEADGVLDIACVSRGALLRVRDNIIVTLGRVSVEDDGMYRIVDDEECEYTLANPVVMFLGVTPVDDDAIVVLADGRIGWVFRDEVQLAS